jgi:RNA polymerase sigma factor (sigma-70 family)
MTTSSAIRTSPSLLGRLRKSERDESAWSEFVNRYGSKILQWCRGRKVQEADAHDITQTILLKLAEKMRTFEYDPTRSFRAYLKTITNYALIDFLESRSRAGIADGGSVALEVLHTVEAREDLVQHLNSTFDQELLEQAMERVRIRVEPHTWGAFCMTAIEGISGSEVAEKLKIKVATVFKARRKVQQMLQEEIRKLDDPES